MANPLETNTSETLQYTALSAPDRLAVALREEGKSNLQISVGLKSEFGIDRAEGTIRMWFTPGGRLEQAYLDYTEKMASSSLKEAKQLARRLSKSAITTLGLLMKENQESNVRLGAAKALANKYIPDRQVLVDGGHEDDLPDELSNDIEEELNAERNGAGADGGQPDADPLEDAGVAEEVRAEQDEDNPPTVLPE